MRFLSLSTTTNFFSSNNSYIPILIIYYFFFNFFIQLSSDEDGTAILHIHNALPMDKGQYTVRAVNKAGEAKCFSHVIVKAISKFDTAPKPSPDDEVHFEEKFEKPVFVETFSPSVHVFTGETIKFECIVVGKPAPKVSGCLINECMTDSGINPRKRPQKIT